MRSTLGFWQRKASRLPRRSERWPRCRPGLELLEARVLLSGDTLATAVPLSLGPGHLSAQVSGKLTQAQQVDLYVVNLNPGDEVSAAVSAQSAGSGLQSQLRVFGPNGQPVALDAQEGGDPQLTFQASTPGPYYIGISSTFNITYNPTVANSGTAGKTTGAYTLQLRETPGAALEPDLAGASFRLGTQTAAWGETVPLQYQVDNRGGAAAAGPFNIDVIVSPNSRFDLPSAQVLQTISVPGLASGSPYLSGSITITLPQNAPAGFSTSGPVYVALSIDPGHAVQAELNSLDQVPGVHRGEDWEELTLVDPVSANGTNTSKTTAQALSDLDSRVTGTLASAQEDWYKFTTNAAGELKAAVKVTGNNAARPRLTLFNPNGEVLIQSDGSLTQQLQPATAYYLSVRPQRDLAAGATANYELISQFVPGNSSTNRVSNVIVADIVGDGKPDDLVVTNYYDNTISVLLNDVSGGTLNTRASFQPPNRVDINPAHHLSEVRMADFNGDGKADLVLTYSNSKTLNVLLGNGDGTFQSAQTTVLGAYPSSITAADLDGDGKADLILAYPNSKTLSVLLSNGNGTFHAAPTPTISLGNNPTSIALTADVINGDGKPDLVVTYYSYGFLGAYSSIKVLRGNGDGTFQPAQSVGNVYGSVSSMTAADIAGDGKPDDLVIAYGTPYSFFFGYSYGKSSSISVLLGNGDGTFGQPQAVPIPAGYLSSVTVADISGDGKSDLILGYNSNDIFGYFFGYSYGNSNTLTARLSKGDGTFQAPETIPVAGNVHTLAVGDMNGDGQPDLVLSYFSGNPLSVRVGKDDGTVKPPQPISLSSSSNNLLTADLNGDGKPDLIITYRDRPIISVLLGNGDGTFQAAKTIKLKSVPADLEVADIYGDGKPDLVVAYYLGFFLGSQINVLEGNGDGTFQPPQTIAPINGVIKSVAVADVNGDGKPDLVVAYRPPYSYLPLFNGSTIRVLLNSGTGKFQDAQTMRVAGIVSSLALADVSGDGKPDLIVGSIGPYNAFDYYSSRNNTISMLLGNGNGTFQPAQIIAEGSDFPRSMLVADVNGDGNPDLVISYHENTYGPFFGYFYGNTSVIRVLLGNGHGTFQKIEQPVATVAGNVSTLAAGYVNGDDKLDLIIGDSYSSVSVLLGKGDGAFESLPTFHVGGKPTAMAVADFNGDGRPDLAIAGSYGSTVRVLLGNGDGTFQNRHALEVGGQPSVVQVQDVNGDHKPDLVVVNNFGPTVDGTVSVLLDNGDGTFRNRKTYAVGSDPRGVAVADLNGDGKKDLVVAGVNSFSVLLGNGDGSFQPAQTFDTSRGIKGVAAADVNGDGKNDIILTYLDSSGSVWQHSSSGFQEISHFVSTGFAKSITVATVSGDDRPDPLVALFSTYYSSGTLSVRLGGNGNFQRTAPSVQVGGIPLSVTVADVTGDGNPDLVVAYTDSAGNAKVNVLQGDGQGNFGALQSLTLSDISRTLSVADIEGDGHPDLVLTYAYSNTVSVLRGNGKGTFQTIPQLIDVGSIPSTIALADVNGDGRADLLVGSNQSSTVSVQLSQGTVAGSSSQVVSFAPPPAVSHVSARNTPFLVNPRTGDTRNVDPATADCFVLGPDGEIYLRKGQGANEPFSPPVPINQQPDGFHPARAMTVVKTPTGWAIAAIDYVATPTTAGQAPVYTVWLYTPQSDGTFQRSAKPVIKTDQVPTGIVAADLHGNTSSDNRDIILVNSLNNSIQVALQQLDGSFSDPAKLVLTTGVAPSDIAVKDVNGDGLNDIVVTSQGSGDVTAFLNDADRKFTTSYRFRSGAGPFGLDPTSATVQSLSEPVSVAVDSFTGAKQTDLVVVNRGTHSFSLLAGDGSGGFATPLITSTFDPLNASLEPGPVVAGDFTGDGPLDLAILMEDTRGEQVQNTQDILTEQAQTAQVWIYAGNGNGTFTHTLTIPVALSASGLSVVTDPSTGCPDLVVGDSFGDVVLIQGYRLPDGQHISFRFPGDHTSLTVEQATGDGQPVVLVGSQTKAQVIVRTPTTTSAKGVTFDNISQTLIAPTASDTSAVAPVPSAFPQPQRHVFQLDEAPGSYPYAVVADSDSNSVLVYPTDHLDSAGQPVYANTPKYIISVGTDPKEVVVQNIKGSDAPDLLVTDAGSNDITTIFGHWDSSGFWTPIAGPRLKSWGQGPLGVTVLYPTPGGNPSLLITNSDGTLVLLPGVGQGFFDDQHPQIFTPNLPVVGPPVVTGPILVLPTPQGLVTFNTQTATFGPVEPVSGTGVVAIDTGPNDSIIALLQNGQVDQLTLTGSDSFQVDQQLQIVEDANNPNGLKGLPVDVSALDVLETASGFEALVTEDGSDYVFVFAPTSTTAGPSSQAITEPPAVGPGAPVATAAAPGDNFGSGPLVLVFTLITGPAEEGATGQAADSTVTGLEGAGASAAQSGGDDAGGDDDEAPADLPTDDNTALGPDLEDALQSLELDAMPAVKPPEAVPNDRTQAPLAPELSWLALAEASLQDELWNSADLLHWTQPPERANVFRWNETDLQATLTPAAAKSDTLMAATPAADAPAETLATSKPEQKTLVQDADSTEATAGDPRVEGVSTAEPALPAWCWAAFLAGMASGGLAARWAVSEDFCRSNALWRSRFPGR